ncbi:MAG: hypothetical protein MZV64_48585 [Ignavibacteriales bacterium]|nr:hypothetical protein [Ignavibacteriales bacterium]
MGPGRSGVLLTCSRESIRWLKFGIRRSNPGAMQTHDFTWIQVSLGYSSEASKHRTRPSRLSQFDRSFSRSARARAALQDRFVPPRALACAAATR